MQASPSTSAAPTPANRLVSLDAYRGAIMLFMASSGFGFAEMARKFPESGFWKFLGFHTSHVAWVGGSAWDMIQPAFMFMVGVAMPFSLLRRATDGQPYAKQLSHACWRALVLIALGVFLASRGRAQTNFLFTNVLAQIGLGYVFLFVLAGRKRWEQITAGILLLAGTWFAFVLYPAPGPAPDLKMAGLKSADAEGLMSGFFAHWSMGLNSAAAFDRWFLNLFPTEKEWVFHSGGYQTLNFVPALVTMLLGLLAGQVLRGEQSQREKIAWLFKWGAGCVALGLLAGFTVCPIVKRIWTPSWTLYSGGIVLWLLALFYWAVEVQGWRRWTFPLVVVGMNSIAIYLLHELLQRWIGDTLKVHLGKEIFSGDYGPVLQRVSVLLVLWLVCWWMYRRKIFLRI
ncbi:MAG: acyltransferase family protein [Verrucomicrobiota bacterium]